MTVCSERPGMFIVLCLTRRTPTEGESIYIAIVSPQTIVLMVYCNVADRRIPNGSHRDASRASYRGYSTFVSIATPAFYMSSHSVLTHIRRVRQQHDL
jgi:hypothetical protein